METFVYIQHVELKALLFKGRLGDLGETRKCKLDLITLIKPNGRVVQAAVLRGARVKCASQSWNN